MFCKELTKVSDEVIKIQICQTQVIMLQMNPSKLAPVAPHSCKFQAKHMMALHISFQDWALI